MVPLMKLHFQFLSGRGHVELASRKVFTMVTFPPSSVDVYPEVNPNHGYFLVLVLYLKRTMLTLNGCKQKMTTILRLPTIRILIWDILKLFLWYRLVLVIIKNWLDSPHWPWFPIPLFEIFIIHPFEDVFCWNMFHIGGSTLQPGQVLERISRRTAIGICPFTYECLGFFVQ